MAVHPVIAKANMKKKKKEMEEKEGGNEEEDEPNVMRSLVM